MSTDCGDYGDPGSAPIRAGVTNYEMDEGERWLGWVSGVPLNRQQVAHGRSRYFDTQEEAAEWVAQQQAGDPVFRLGDLLAYQRHRDGEIIAGVVRTIIPIPHDYCKQWPKMRHCPYAYRLAVPPDAGGYRTVDECRLSYWRDGPDGWRQLADDQEALLHRIHEHRDTPTSSFRLDTTGAQRARDMRAARGLATHGFVRIERTMATINRTRADCTLLDLTSAGTEYAEKRLCP